MLRWRIAMIVRVAKVRRGTLVRENFIDDIHEVILVSGAVAKSDV